MADLAEPSPRVDRGCILAYRVFDVADEILLDAAEKLLAEAPGRRRVTLSRERQSLEFTALPLDIELGTRKLDLKSSAGAEAQLSARFFDYGAISVEFEFPIATGTALDALVPLCSELYESARLEDYARRELDALLPRVSQALQGKHDWRGVET